VVIRLGNVSRPFVVKSYLVEASSNMSETIKITLFSGGEARVAVGALSSNSNSNPTLKKQILTYLACSNRPCSLREIQFAVADDLMVRQQTTSDSLVELLMEVKVLAARCLRLGDPRYVINADVVPIQPEADARFRSSQYLIRMPDDSSLTISTCPEDDVESVTCFIEDHSPFRRQQFYLVDTTGRPMRYGVSIGEYRQPFRVILKILGGMEAPIDPKSIKGKSEEKIPKKTLRPPKPGERKGREVPVKKAKFSRSKRDMSLIGRSAADAIARARGDADAARERLKDKVEDGHAPTAAPIFVRPVKPEVTKKPLSAAGLLRGFKSFSCGPFNEQIPNWIPTCSIGAGALLFLAGFERVGSSLILDVPAAYLVDRITTVLGCRLDSKFSVTSPGDLGLFSGSWLLPKVFFGCVGFPIMKLVLRVLNLPNMTTTPLQWLCNRGFFVSLALGSFLMTYGVRHYAHTVTLKFREPEACVHPPPPPHPFLHLMGGRLFQLCCPLEFQLLIPSRFVISDPIQFHILKLFMMILSSSMRAS
jgi:hypothetical protein